MRNIVIGIFVGVSFGIVLGASVIAPRLHNRPNDPIADTLAAIPVPAVNGDQHRETAFWSIPGVDNRRGETDVELTQRAYDSIASATGGAIAFRTIYNLKDNKPGETDKTAGSVYTRVIDGSIDAAIVQPGEGAGLSPALSLFGAAPFGPRPRELMAWLYAGGGLDLLNEVHRDRGLVAVPCGMTSSSAAGWFRRDVTGPDDLRGLRMRIAGLAADAARKLGIETVDLRDEQLPAAFRTGILDAADASLPSADRSLADDKGARHYLFPGWHAPASLWVLIMRQDTWNGISPLRQHQIRFACGDNVRYGVSQTDARQFEALKAIASHGVEVGRLPDNVLKAFSGAWHKVAAEQAAKDKSFAAVWKSLSTFREDYAIWNDISSF